MMMIIIMVVVVIMMISRMKVIFQYQTSAVWNWNWNAAREGADISRVRSPRKCGVGGHGFDGRQTCGAEAVIMVQMVFQEGEVSV